MVCLPLSASCDYYILSFECPKMCVKHMESTCYVERLLKIWNVKPLYRFLCAETPFNATEMKKISTVMNLAQAVHLLNNMEEGKNSSFPEAVSLSYILNISACHKENCLTDSLRPCRTVHCEQILQKRGIFDCFI